VFDTRLFCGTVPFMDHTSKPKLARGSYWCPRAQSFLQPGEAGYDAREYERLVLGPAERGVNLDESGVFSLTGIG
jgi:hypothetical protein